MPRSTRLPRATFRPAPGVCDTTLYSYLELRAMDRCPDRPAADSLARAGVARRPSTLGTVTVAMSGRRNIDLRASGDGGPGADQRHRLVTHLDLEFLQAGVGRDELLFGQPVLAGNVVDVLGVVPACRDGRGARLVGCRTNRRAAAGRRRRGRGGLVITDPCQQLGRGQASRARVVDGVSTACG